jgi:hypothetical protein
VVAVAVVIQVLFITAKTAALVAVAIILAQEQTEQETRLPQAQAKEIMEALAEQATILEVAAVEQLRLVLLVRRLVVTEALVQPPL